MKTPRCMSGGTRASVGASATIGKPVNGGAPAIVGKRPNGSAPATIGKRAPVGAPVTNGVLESICLWALLSLLPHGAAVGTAVAGTATPAPDTVAAQPAARVEARSTDLLAVGIVQDDHMVVHLSRVVDNAPVRDAALTVLLRGVVHPTTAEADGSYTLRAKDLALPGSAAVVFQVAQGNVHEDIKGALDIAGTAGKTEDKNSARQLGWWVLNFAVCIGFLLLLSRRRKAAAAAEE